MNFFFNISWICFFLSVRFLNFKDYKNYSVIGVQQIDRVVEVVETTLRGLICRYVGSKRVEDETGKKK